MDGHVGHGIWNGSHDVLGRCGPSHCQVASRIAGSLGRSRVRLGWADTDAGSFYLQRAAAYGVTTSYTQTFLWAKELLLGEGTWLWRTEPGEAEIHVDRHSTSGARAVRTKRISATSTRWSRRCSIDRWKISR